MSMASQGCTMEDVVARALEDDEFRQRLLTDATGTLNEMGVILPKGVAVKVLENTAGLVHLVIPVKPAFEVTDDELTAWVEAGLAEGRCLLDASGFEILC